MLGSPQPRREAVKKKESALNVARRISETEFAVGNGPSTPKGTTKVLSREKMRRTEVNHVT
jgi:hypothetical protein